MGRGCQLTREEERLFIEYLQKMITEGKVRPSSSPVGIPILFIPKTRWHRIEAMGGLWTLKPTYG
jgi:hypothetical protein